MHLLANLSCCSIKLFVLGASGWLVGHFAFKYWTGKRASEKTTGACFFKIQYTNQYDATMAVDKAIFNVLIPQKCTNPGITISLKAIYIRLWVNDKKYIHTWKKEQFLTSASLPPKILSSLLWMPHWHWGTQSREATGIGVMISSEVLVEWSPWVSSLQELVLGLNSAILEGVSLDEFSNRSQLYLYRPSFITVSIQEILVHSRAICPMDCGPVRSRRCP